MWALRPINQEDNGRTRCDEEHTTKRDPTTGPEKPLGERGAQVAATVRMRKRDRWSSAPIGERAARPLCSGAKIHREVSPKSGPVTEASGLHSDGPVAEP
jgi:hypothetical protein